MAKKVRIGVIGSGGIANGAHLPGYSQIPDDCEIFAICDILPEALEKTAAKYPNIPHVVSDYKALLAMPEIDGVSVCTPNFAHHQITMDALRAGKNVLCEKPISLTVAEAKTLTEVQSRTGVIIGEAFMVRTHPQWLRTRALIDAGRIGTLRVIQAFFSYTNVNPANIRNIPEYGGGGLMDIGCYPIHISRYLFGEEPTRVFGCIDRDPQMDTDRLTSALMDFPSGQATFTCSTQLVPYQRVHVFGTKGRIELEIPFNAPPDRPTRIFIDGSPDAPPDVFGNGILTETFPVCDQYTLQGDAFSKAIRDGAPAPVPVTDAIKNMAVIEAIFRSASSGLAENPTA